MHVESDELAVLGLVLRIGAMAIVDAGFRRHRHQLKFIAIIAERMRSRCKGVSLACVFKKECWLRRDMRNLYIRRRRHTSRNVNKTNCVQMSRVSYGIEKEKDDKVDGPKGTGTLNGFNGAFDPRLPDASGLMQSNDATNFPTRKHVLDVSRYLGTCIGARP